VLTWSNPAAQQTATRKDGPPSGREPVQALKALEVLCKGTTDEMANGRSAGAATARRFRASARIFLVDLESGELENHPQRLRFDIAP
jgi:hypothetical protein